MSGLMECPYGVPGDRFWVQEEFRIHPQDWASYIAGGFALHEIPVDYKLDPMPDGFDGVPWSPARFMPRWASRIELEIVSVRAERLHQITEDGAVEGVEFARLWESLHGAGSWDANPWVWVIGFKVVSLRYDYGAGTMGNEPV